MRNPNDEKKSENAIRFFRSKRVCLTTYENMVRIISRTIYFKNNKISALSLRKIIIFEKKGRRMRHEKAAKLSFFLTKEFENLRF